MTCTHAANQPGAHARMHALMHASRHVHKRAHKCNVTDSLTALSADGISTFNISMSVETRSCLSPYLPAYRLAFPSSSLPCLSLSLSLSPCRSSVPSRRDNRTFACFHLCACVFLKTTKAGERLEPQRSHVDSSAWSGAKKTDRVETFLREIQPREKKRDAVTGRAARIS